MSTEPDLQEILDELQALDDPKVRAVNERHGDKHGVNLTKLRGVAKRLKTQHEFSKQLWASGDPVAKLLATLVCKPKEFTEQELDAMMREAETPKELDWLTSYVVAKSPHMGSLRTAWMRDKDPKVASAAWALTSGLVAKNKDDHIDLEALLDQIEAEMRDAPERLQWQMNMVLGNIGIVHEEHRARALAIGEKLEVLKDYPTSPGCVSPYVPLWINEMVGRAK